MTRSIRLGLAAALLACSPVLAQGADSLATFASTTQTVRYDSGVRSNPAGNERVLARRELTFPGSTWVQLHFDAATKLPPGSRLRLTSIADRGVQHHDGTTLPVWNGMSAAFNGDSVLLELVAAPGVQNARVVLASAKLGVSVLAGTVCGATDDRAASNDQRVGRLLDGNTGFMVFDNVMVTAGTALVSATSLIEFNVPQSTITGLIVRSAPDDQYPFSVSEADATGPGQNWGVCVVGVNSNTGLLPPQAPGGGVIPFGSVPGTASMQPMHVIGFGTTQGSPLPAAFNFAQTDHTGPLQQANPADLCYEVDVRAGNAGSPVIDVGSGNAVAIHTNGDCQSTGCNTGTRFDNANLLAALAPFDPNIAAADPYGTGCPAPAAFYETFIGAPDLNGSALQLNIAGGGFAVSNCTSGCFDPVFGTNLGLGDEQVSNPLLLGFTLNLPGGVSTQAINISSNGWIGLIAGQFFAADFTPNVTELLNQPARLAPMWTDLDPSAGGDVFFRQAPGAAIVTFSNVAEFNSPGSSNTFQVQFEAAGRIKIFWDSQNTAGSPLVGYSPGNVTVDPGPTDLSAVPFGTGNGAPPLTLNATPPQLGSMSTITLSNLPANATAASFYVGFNPANLDLSFVGAPGCRFLTTGDAEVGLILAGTSASLTFPVPNDSTLSGSSIFLQGLGVAPGLSTFGFGTSNGIDYRFGQ